MSPAEATMRARIEEAAGRVKQAVAAKDWLSSFSWSLREHERRDALAIIEAKR